jgi:hypothetical protein
MPAHPVTMGFACPPIRRQLLQKLVALIIVAANLSLDIFHVIAGNLEDNSCRPNVVLILADDKAERASNEASFLREGRCFQRKHPEFRSAADCGRFGAIPLN